MTCALGIVGLGYLICYILILIKMFKNGATGLAILSILLNICGGLGSIIAFVMGWIKHKEWNTKNIMIVWTILLVINIGVGALAGPQIQSELQQYMPKPPAELAP